MYINFSKLLEENRGLLHTKISNQNIMMPDLMIWKQISPSHDKDV
jgi:hypothetical protein